MPEKIHNIFDHKYSNDGLKSQMRKLVPKRAITDTLTPILIPTVEFKGEGRGDLVWIDSDEPKFKNWTYVDALLTTSAAPTFFPHFKKDDQEYIDGGLFENNPSEEVAARLRSMLSMNHDS
jgi:patatin-like phospholipase/acyl hydrolase